MADELSFRVDGYPPAKSEALSMLGAGHRHGDRVTRLLEAARDAIATSGFGGFGSRPIGLSLVVRCPRDRNRSDATNYLGGVADVLESKADRGSVDHLGELGNVALYDNDRQLETLSYTWREAVEPSYDVRLWDLRCDDDHMDLDLRRGSEGEPRPSDPPDTERFTRERLAEGGFVGWLTFEELRRADVAEVPPIGGVYVVVRASAGDPEFLDANAGGHFKGRDPTVEASALAANWVDEAQVVYIGKANSLKRRLREFERFGSGAPIGHWGGRLIWQLRDHVELRVAWKPTGQEHPAGVETDLIAAFRTIYGKPPFANDPHLLGR